MGEVGKGGVGSVEGEFVHVAESILDGVCGIRRGAIGEREGRGRGQEIWVVDVWPVELILNIEDIRVAQSSMGEGTPVVGE